MPSISCLEFSVGVDLPVEGAVPMLEPDMDRGVNRDPIRFVIANPICLHQRMTEVIEPDLANGAAGRLRDPDRLDQVQRCQCLSGEETAGKANGDEEGAALHILNVPKA